MYKFHLACLLVNIYDAIVQVLHRSRIKETDTVHFVVKLLMCVSEKGYLTALQQVEFWDDGKRLSNPTAEPIWFRDDAGRVKKLMPKKAMSLS